MPFRELEKKRCEKAIAGFMERRRPPPHIRDALDFGFSIKGQSVEIFEVRPFWRNPDETIEEAVAKATFVKKRGLWKVY